MLGLGLLLGALVLFGPSAGEVVLINLPALDEVLAQAQAVLQEEGNDALHLSDLSEPFEFDVYGKSLKGQFSAQDGLLSNLSTISRVGLVEVTKNADNTIDINATVKFDPLDFYYNNYQLKYLSLDSHGAIRITRPQSTGTIHHKIVENADSSCSYTTEFNFINQGSVKTVVSGSDLPEQFLPFVNSWILHSFATSKIHDLQEIVVDALKKSLDRNGPLCKAFFS